MGTSHTATTVVSVMMAPSEPTNANSALARPPSDRPSRAKNTHCSTARGTIVVSTMCGGLYARNSRQPRRTASAIRHPGSDQLKGPPSTAAVQHAGEGHPGHEEVPEAERGGDA